MKNRFFSYKIKNDDITRNNDCCDDFTFNTPVKSYEIKIAKFPKLNNNKDKKINICIKFKNSKEKRNISSYLQKSIKKKSKNLYSLREQNKRIKFFFFDTSQRKNEFNNMSKFEKNKKNSIRISHNKKSLLSQIKKFRSCQNLILGKYPVAHKLLLPIQHDFKVNNDIIEEKTEIKKKKKKEINKITVNAECKKNNKEKEIEIEGKNNKNIDKKTNDNKNDKANKEENIDIFKKKIKIILKIRENKNNYKSQRSITIVDKINRINEYSERIKQMNSNRIKRKNTEMRDEEMKESLIDINKSKDFINNNGRNSNMKTEKIEIKSSSANDIFAAGKINNIKPKYLKPISNNKRYDLNIDSNKENPNINIIDVNQQKIDEVKNIKDDKDDKEPNKEIDKEIHKEENIQLKETQNKNTEKSTKDESIQITNKDKLKIRKSFLTKDEILERIIKTRKEYLEKEKNQSIQNITQLYYLIFPGNASYLIKNCMNHRINWKEPFSNVSSFYNFKWTELSNSLDYYSLGNFYNSKQLVNHYENHYSISNKASMFFNFLDYCENNNMSIFKYVPFTIVYRIRDRSGHSDAYKETKRKHNLKNLEIFMNNIDKYVKLYDEIGEYFGKDIKDENKNENLETEINEEQFVVENVEENLPFYSNIFQNFDKFKKVEKKDKNDKKNKLQKIGAKTKIEIPLTHFSTRNIWLIKAINLNRGMCIKIVKNFSEMEKIIEKFRQGVNYNFTEQAINEKDEEVKSEQNHTEDNKKEEEEESTYICDNIIIQKYIENPLLYKGRKFDMRIWVLLTHQMKVFIFKEGHLKTCSIKYNIDSQDSFGHITNYSFQKNNGNFEKYELGNEVPFYEFQKYIDEKYPEKNYQIKIDLMKQLKNIIELTMKSVKNKINKNNRNFQFEIFGYDFMLDEDFNVFLIEINTNPGLEESSPWIKIIVPRMLDDALRLTLDQIFETKYDFNLNYKNEENIKNYNIVMRKLKNKENPNSVNKLVNHKFIDKIEELKIDEENKNKINEEDKSNKEKKLNYISPFPVPGYELHENLWDLVCDLNEKELEKDQSQKTDKECITGIKHLLKKKNDKITT